MLATGHKANFETLKTASATVSGPDGVPTGLHRRTRGSPLAANRQPDGEVEFAPFAMMFNGNPYEAINPPKPGDGFFTQDEIWGD